MVERKIFYGRVSTEQQSILRQTDMAEKLNIKDEDIYWEKMTGKKANRPALSRMLKDIQEEQMLKDARFTLYIESLSRLGRSTKDLLALLEKLDNLKVSVVSSKEQIDTSTPTGRLLITLLCALAEFERDLTVERTKAGLEASRKRGIKGGRPGVDKRNIKVALSLYDSREYSIKEICARCSISQGSLYKYIREREAS